MNLLIIVTGIIVLIGSVITLFNFFYFYHQGSFHTNTNIIRHVVSGLGAAILTPLLLENIFTQMPEHSTVEYLVLFGFCFVAGYFSDRILNSLAKAISSVFSPKKKTVDEPILINNPHYTDRNLNIEEENNLDSTNYKKTDEKKNIHQELDMKIQEEILIKTFSDKNKVRTAREIAVELDVNSIAVSILLEELHGQGKLKKLTCSNGNVHYALTQNGKALKYQEN